MRHGGALVVVMMMVRAGGVAGAPAAAAPPSRSPKAAHTSGYDSLRCCDMAAHRGDPAANRNGADVGGCVGAVAMVLASKSLLMATGLSTVSVSRHERWGGRRRGWNRRAQPPR